MFAKSGAGTRSRPRPGSGNRFCPPARPIHQRLEQWKVVRQIFENALEVPLEPLDARPRFGTRRIPPRGELLRHDFLDRLAVGEIRRASRACPNEVVLAQGQARGEIGHLDQSTDVRGRRGLDAEPDPAALDDFPEGADGNALPIGLSRKV